MTRLALQTGIFGDGMLGDRPERDLSGALDDVRTAGYDGVEVMANLISAPALLRDACAERGLTVEGLHVFWWELAEPPVRAALEVLGTRRLLVSCLPVKEPDDVPEVSRRLRELAGELRPLGVSVLLHNHAPECRVLADGRTAFEALAELLAPGEVDFVIDLHWAAVAGTLLRTVEAVGARCDYYHVKDGSLATPKDGVSYDLGTGEVDLPAAWRLIRRRPVTVATVERGYPPADQPAALRRDAGYVRRLLAERN